MPQAERNAAKLIAIMVEHFGCGCTSEDLLEKYEAIAKRKPATYYAALSVAKANHWIINDGRILTLNPDGCWKEPSVGESLPDADRLEFVCQQQAAEIDRLRAEVARLTTDADAHAVLKSIYSDPGAPQGYRIKAASAALPHERPKIGVSVSLTSTGSQPLAEMLLERRRRTAAMQIEMAKETEAELLADPKRNDGDD